MSVEAVVQHLWHDEQVSDALYEASFDAMMQGGVSDVLVSALLSLLAVRQQEARALPLLVAAMRRVMRPFDVSDDVIDNCGTGGDGSGSFNISTAAALLSAAMGMKVAKHGNRAVSSQAGSADVLAALGGNIEADAAAMQQSLQECGFCFLFAPMFHPAMKHVAQVRKTLAQRTIFNMAGPLANPARHQYALLGVFDDSWRDAMARAFHDLGGKKAWVVHGSGYDEIIAHAPTHVTILHEDGTREEWCLRPEEWGMSNASPDDVAGGSAADNARMMEALLQGKDSPAADVVALNSAAMAVIVGLHENVKDALGHARQTLHEGKALEVLHRYCRVSHGG